MRVENLAIAFTDIKGFTERTSRQTRAETERLLKVHEMLLVPVFKAFAGTVRKSIGDAYLVTFGSPTNAVLCGVAIQDRLFTFNQSAPEVDRIQVRVAINVGEVRVEVNDAFGEPVNVAARVEGVAEANQVYFTEAVYLAMNKAEVPAEDLGSFALEGVPEQVRLFRVPPGPYRSGSGPLAPQNLPDPALPFGGVGIGRAPGLPPPDLASIDRALAARQSRRRLWFNLGGARRAKQLVALLGGGGVALVLAAWALHLAWTPKVERLLAAGDFAGANQLVQAMPAGPERELDAGRIAQMQAHWKEAVGHYVEAAHAEAWRKRSIDRLGEIAAQGDCQAKVHVADGLGKIGDGYARPILEQISREKPQGAQGGLFGLLGGGGCDPHRAAEQALQRLGVP